MMTTNKTGLWRWTKRAVFLMAVVVVSSLPAPSFGQDVGRHVVKAGDTLFGIARTYGITLESLREANRISGDDIRVGQVLVIPAKASAVDSMEESRPDLLVRESVVKDSILVPVQPDSTLAPDSKVTPEPRGFPSTHLRSDQSIYDLAFSAGLEVDTLLKLNPDLPVFLDSTRILLPSGHQVGAVATYTVRTGDTLYKIAREHGTSLEELRRLNHLATDVIRVGQRLQVSGTATSRTGGEAWPPLITTGHVRPYPSRFAGRLMAGGKEYDPDRYYVSHPDLPFGSIVLLTNTQDGSRTFAEVADRLPSTAEYAMDVSVAVALALDVGGKSNPEIEIRVVRFGTGR